MRLLREKRKKNWDVDKIQGASLHFFIFYFFSYIVISLQKSVLKCFIFTTSVVILIVQSRKKSPKNINIDGLA